MRTSGRGGTYLLGNYVCDPSFIISGVQQKMRRRKVGRTKRKWPSYNEVALVKSSTREKRTKKASSATSFLARDKVKAREGGGVFFIKS